MRKIRAKWENGVFVPAEPVDFPEGAEVLLRKIRVVGSDTKAAVPRAKRERAAAAPGVSSRRSETRQKKRRTG
jgi:predicted DNA-binding antitoxin AbrB/MazE fold protein